MLENELYTILKLETGDGSSPVVAEITLNENHPLFAGHFPGNPILPGVCTVQIIRELLEKAEKKPLLMVRAVNIKYLGFIVPSVMPVVVFSIRRSVRENGEITCSAAVSANGSPVCSFKGDFTVFPESAFHSRPAGVPPA